MTTQGTLVADKMIACAQERNAKGQTRHQVQRSAAHRVQSYGAVLAVALLFLIAGVGAASASCCVCTTPFDAGNFCGPTQFVPCGLSNADVQCSSQVIIGGTCVGGDQPNGSGTGGVCTAPQAQAPVLGGPASPAFAMTALGLMIAGAALLVRRARK
jgi:hypothetical protein